MSDRRYTETEVAEIIRIASELEHGGPRALASANGLTLGEIQQIGTEAGLSPELIARAARLQAGIGTASTSRLAGLPIGVSRTVELDRHVSDTEWEQLVGQLRETFEAKGVIKYDGPFRQWSNGNLHVLLEPSERGHRVRFRTTNGLSRSLITTGVLLIGVSILVALINAVGSIGQPAVSVGPPIGEMFGIGTLGAVVAGIGALRLPSWAEKRRKQMEELARRLISRGSDTRAG